MTQNAEPVTPADFARMVAREGDKVELKTGTGSRPLQEAIVGFSNTPGGGVIYIGVTDDRQIVGRALDQGTDDAIRQASLDVKNPGRLTVDEIRVGSKIARRTNL